MRHAGRQAGDACQQRRRGRVHVHADGVHAIFHHGVERAGQLALAHIVLVLAHADRFRINLDQFGQRVLQAARDRHGAAQGHIHVRQFLGGEFGRRIHGRARFRDDDLRHLRFRVLLDQILRQFIGLARGGAVADRNERHIVLGGQTAQRVQGAIPVVFRLVRVDHGRVDDFTGGIDHGDLDARAQAGIEAHGGALAGRRGQQQRFQIGGEDVDRIEFRAFAQRTHQFRFQVHEAFHAPGPARRVRQPFVGRAALLLDAEADGDAAFARIVRRIPFRFFRFRVQAQGDVENTFAAAAQQRQRAVRWHCRNGFRVVEIIGEFFAFVLLAFHHFRFDDAVFLHVFAQGLQQGCVFGETFHQDLARAVEGCLGVRHARIIPVGTGKRVAQELARFHFRRQFGIVQQTVGQRHQARFDGDLRLRAALLLVGQVQIFQARLVFRVHDGVEQLGRHLVLFRDRGHDGGAPLFQFAQVAQALFEQAQLDIVEATGRFLAVTGDEGHGGAFVEQFDGGGNLHRFGGKFKGKALFDSGQHGCFQSDQAWNDTQSARLRNLDSANGLCVDNSVSDPAAAGWRALELAASAA